MSRGSLGGGSGGRGALVLGAADLGGGGRVLGGAQLLDVILAGTLTVLVAGVGLNAVGVELLADEGGQRLGVVLETRSRAVGGARAVVLESSLVAVVVIGVVVAKNLAGVGLGLAPNGSLLLGNSVGINSHVKRALVGRDLGRHQSSGDGNENSGGSHLERRFGGIKLRDNKKKRQGTKTADEAKLQERGQRLRNARRAMGVREDGLLC